MKRLLALLLLFPCLTHAQWNIHYDLPENQYVADLAKTSSGDLVVCGAVGNTFLGGQRAMFISYTPDGEVIWASEFDGFETQSATEIEVLEDGFFALGSHEEPNEFGQLFSQALLYRLNPAGEVLWTQSYGDQYNDYGRSLALREDGHLALAGEFYEPDLGKNAVVVHTDTDGEVVWTFSHDTGNSDVALQVEWLPGDKLAMLSHTFVQADSINTTYALHKLNPDGTELWSTPLDGPLNEFYSSFVKLISGDFICLGKRYSSTGSLAMMTKVASDGEIVWKKYFPWDCSPTLALNEALSYGIQIEEDLMLVTGNTCEESQLLCINTAGEVLWQEPVATAFLDASESMRCVQGIVPMGSDEVVLATSLLTLDFDQDIMLSNLVLQDHVNVSNNEAMQETEVVATYNLMGQHVPEDFSGLTIVRYSDGSARKIWRIP